MLNIATSPVNFDCLQLLDLVLKVQAKVTGEEGICWVALYNAIHAGRPATQIINTIKDMATDNYNAVADVLGKSLTDKILKA